MNNETLNRLQKLNQLQLNDDETALILDFFSKTEKDLDKLNAVDTDGVERMVHVMPMTNVIRDDVAEQKFTRDELQAGAPESYDGYWQVPRLVE